MQCSMSAGETVEHMFSECVGYANERKVLFEVVNESDEGNSCWCGS